MNKTKIRILSLATGPYEFFIPDFLSSIKEAYTEKEVDLKVNIFSDSLKWKDMKFGIDVEFIDIPHKPWPLPALEKYENIRLISKKIDKDEFLILTDIDMRFKSWLPLTQDIKLFGVEHPGYFSKLRKPFVRDRNSRVFIPKHLRDIYLCAGVQGGYAKYYLEAVEFIAKITEEDLLKKKIPRWHDESYWNYYFSLFKHDFTVFGPQYCWPEEWETSTNPGEIIAITKSSDISESKFYLNSVLTLAGKVKRRIKKKTYPPTE